MNMLLYKADVILGLGGGEIILDYPSGPKLITEVLRSRETFLAVVREKEM